jgi:hypothetical protein
MEKENIKPIWDYKIRKRNTHPTQAEAPFPFCFPSFFIFLSYLELIT